MSSMTALRRPATVILRAAELGLWTDARALVDDARGQAASLVEHAAVQCAREREAGRAEGLAEARAEMAARLAELSARRQSALAEIEAALPELVGAVLDRILGHGDREALLRQAIRHALAEINRGGPAQLRVAPECQAAAQAALQGHDAITVEPDDTLQAGACRFECEYGSVELGLDAQLAALRDGLARAAS